MTMIKVCGLTRIEDVLAVREAGADMVGFIHVSKSPRYVCDEQLGQLLAAAGPLHKVIVVQNEPAATLRTLRGQFSFDDFQFHGDESSETTALYGGYRVFHMSDANDPPTTFGKRFLLDTAVKGQRGGTGKTFNWDVLPRVAGRYLVAGGLTPENVADLVSTYHPWGVDVSSGVEKTPGIKDHQKIKQFIENVRRASAHE